jgi:hypothetical protein
VAAVASALATACVLNDGDEITATLLRNTRAWTRTSSTNHRAGDNTQWAARGNEEGGGGQRR